MTDRESKASQPAGGEPAESQAPTTVEKLRGLPWGVAWSVTNSVFAQYTFFGSIFVLYLNQLGLDKAQIGGLLSVVPFLGIIAVFIAGPLDRIGHKRVFLVSTAVRTTTAILLLVTPWILLQFGQAAVLGFILVIVAVFALFRATAFTAFYPWLQEQVPDRMRGKYTAVKNALASLSTFLAVMVAGYVLGSDPDLARFLFLIAAGVVFGYVSVWIATRIPGGAPARGQEAGEGSYQGVVIAVRDANFARYLAGVGLVTLATVPLVSFVPLFMKEEVGLSSGQVVWLEAGVLLGGLVSSYLWGWLADRYGSKPVMAWGVYLLPLLPLAWLVMPQKSAWSLYVALVIALGQGLFNTGWLIGSGRLLYVRVVPVAKRTAYMAVYFAWIGIAGGLAQLMGGWLVELAPGWSGRWEILNGNPYTLLFVVCLILPLAAALLLRGVRADSGVTTRQFTGMFLRGNPFLAMESLVRYHRARDERSAVTMTERLGRTKSPLTVEELIEALHDPRFYVRFEAVVSMARHGPDPRLIEALIETLEGQEPALSTVAAWGLGRMGDGRAVEALRRGLDARYRSVQAHCARSLGSLGDRAVIPLLVQRLETEEDVGLQMALASSLGSLGATEAAGRLLALLRTARGQDVRMEFALALARLVGAEHSFIQLLRNVEADPGTSLSQEVTRLEGRLHRAHQTSDEMEAALEAAAVALAQEAVEEGIALLQGALAMLPLEPLGGASALVVQDCVAQMGAFGAGRLEYVVLALHALESAMEARWG
jgi:MFS family permease/HEAT repeat protein